MHWSIRLIAGLLGGLLGIMPAAGAERPAHIQRAINRGVSFLKASQGADDGQWHFAQAANVFLWQNVGATALAGLTLLECDVPANDPAVQRAAQVVREASLSQIQTYSLALSIMFLDRLGEEADVPLIQSMTVRLLGGQKAAGGWSYQCPAIPADEVRRLTDQLKRQNELRGGKEMPKKKNPEEGAPRELPKEIQAQLRRITPPAAQPMQPVAGGNNPTDALLAISGVEGDNSNTQFATLALWVARRNGMPVEDALMRVDSRFRRTQHPDGGWTYISTTQPLPRDWSFPAAMTCSGLIGLAVGQGIAKDNKDLNKDPNIKAGFTNLANHLQALSGVSVMGGRQEKGFYFLWSLERVAEVYGIKMIGKTDWYRWASQVLINSQQADGGFYGEYARGGVDTCFALLMLARANVAKDLSHNLRGRLKDGIVTLRSGGVGREALQNIGKKSADAKSDQSKDSKSVDSSGKASSAAGPIEKENVESHAARLSNELTKADGTQQNELLEKFQEGKGTMYTLAIAGAIPRLSGEAKTKARDALATRFTRMTAATLRQELQDDDPEIRRAASLACAMKDDKSHIPDLIPMLQDREPIVGRAAHAALKSLSGKDFGPKTGATPQDLANAVAAWKGWWDKSQEDKNQGK
jgi:hypothetical protein